MHSSILAWKTPRTYEPGGLQLMGVAKIQTRLSMHAQYDADKRQTLNIRTEKLQKQKEWKYIQYAETKQKKAGTALTIQSRL